MVVECAWCGGIVGQKDGLGLEGTTSGICSKCFARIIEQIAVLEERAAREKEATDAERAPPSGRLRVASGH